MNTALNKSKNTKKQTVQESFFVSDFNFKSVKVVKNNFDTAKTKLFKMLDEGINSKNNFVADSNFWKEFKKIS